LRAPSEIALGCAPAMPDWLAARLLGPAPPAALRAEAFDSASPSLAAERLATSDLAPVPEPRALFCVGLGLAGLATARRRVRVSQRG
jgi:hypothetical protein